MDVPETRFAQSGDLSIAYRVIGDGDGGVDIVHVPGLLDTLELAKSDAGLDDLYQRLGRFARLILLDKRGTGLSDRLRLDAAPTLEERIDDVRAVMDAVGLEKAALLGVADGGPVAMYFAAAHPERTTALVLRATTPRLAWAPDWPMGVPPDAAAQMIADVERDWGTRRGRPLLGRGGRRGDQEGGPHGGAGRDAPRGRRVVPDNPRHRRS